MVNVINSDMNTVVMNTDTVIMPTSIQHYKGSIKYRDHTGKYTAYFKRLYRFFYTYEEAFDWIKKQNHLEGNRHVRNIIYYDASHNYYSCNLSYGGDVNNRNSVIFDESRLLPIIQSNVLYVRNNIVYMKSFITNNTIEFSRVVLHREESIKHEVRYINRNPLDIRKKNMQDVNPISKEYTLYYKAFMRVLLKLAS